MNNKEKIYSDIKSKYFSIKIIHVYKEAKTLLLFSLLIICLLLFATLLYLTYSGEIYNSISLFSGLAFLVIIFFAVKYTNKYFYKKYPSYEDFIKSEQDLWRGCRYVLFIEQIKGLPFCKKEMIELIDSEIEVKSFDISKSFHALIMIPLGLLIVNAFISKMADPSNLIFLLGIYLVIYYFLSATTSVYKSKTDRLKELKYFLILKDESTSI